MSRVNFVALGALGALMAGSVACTPGARGAAGGAPASAGVPHLTILHFNDVYEITPVEGGKAGGLARVAAYRRHLIDSVGPVLTTLGGDFVSPSALGTSRVNDEPLAGKQMVAVLNAVGLDWTTLGNHEFDIGERRMRQRLEESRFQYVASNVTDSAGRPFPKVQPHAIVRIASGGRTLRVGLVGVVVPSNPQPWVKYEDPIASIAAHAAMIRDSVDILIGLTHLSVQQDQRVAEEVPSIDVILGGHEHENYLLQRGPNLTPIIKGDANVRTVAVVRIEPGARGSRARVSSTLIPITDRTPTDSAVAAEAQRWIDVAFAGYRKQGFAPEAVVATLRASLDGRETTVRTRPGPLSDAILAGMRAEATEAEVAIFNGGSIRIDDVVPAGALTQYDVIRILPFGGVTVRADVTGRLLKQVLTIGRQNAGSGGYLHASGAKFDEGGALLVNGAPVEDDRWYKLVLTDFLLSGNESRLGFLTRTNPEVKVIRELRDIRLSLIDQLRRM